MMIKQIHLKLIVLLCFVAIGLSSVAKKPKPKNNKTVDNKLEIRAVLTKQQQAWNDGKLEMYMQGYWNSDSLTFVGKRGVTRGWKNTLDTYKKSYPDKAAMGKLSLQVLNLKLYGNDLAFVVGKWDLTRSSGNVGGYFTLLMRKINENWVIVADHSS
jgi:hypothetical protein